MYVSKPFSHWRVWFCFSVFSERHERWCRCHGKRIFMDVSVSQICDHCVYGVELHDQMRRNGNTCVSVYTSITKEIENKHSRTCRICCRCKFERKKIISFLVRNKTPHARIARLNEKWQVQMQKRTAQIYYLLWRNIPFRCVHFHAHFPFAFLCTCGVNKWFAQMRRVWR